MCQVQIMNWTDRSVQGYGRAMSARHLATLLFIAAMFGASFLYMRVASPVVGPWIVAWFRVVIAALVLLAVVRRPGLAQLRRDWRPFLFLGLVNSAIPFAFIAFAEQTIGASLAAVLNATTPLATAVLAAFFLAQPLTAARIGAIGLGIAGVGVVAGLGPLTLDPPTLLAIGAMVAGASSYGVALTFVRRRFSGRDPVVLTFGQLVTAAVILAPGAAITAPATVPGPEVVVSIVLLATLSTALPWPLLFRLVGAVGPMATSTVTFIMPVFGVLWGVLLLGEELGPGLVAGAALILASLVLILDLGRLIRGPGRIVDSLWTRPGSERARAESRG
jgi:drug/metabolite transporter (DMT)-like permease